MVEPNPMAESNAHSHSRVTSEKIRERNKVHKKRLRANSQFFFPQPQLPCCSLLGNNGANTEHLPKDSKQLSSI